jgi:hypothetical protein
VPLGNDAAVGSKRFERVMRRRVIEARVREIDDQIDASGVGNGGR